MLLVANCCIQQPNRVHQGIELLSVLGYRVLPAREIACNVSAVGLVVSKRFGHDANGAKPRAGIDAGSGRASSALNNAYCPRRSRPAIWSSIGSATVPVHSSARVARCSWTNTRQRGV